MILFFFKYLSFRLLAPLAIARKVVVAFRAMALAQDRPESIQITNSNQWRAERGRGERGGEGPGVRREG